MEKEGRREGGKDGRKEGGKGGREKGREERRKEGKDVWAKGVTSFPLPPPLGPSSLSRHTWQPMIGPPIQVDIRGHP